MKIRTKILLLLILGAIVPLSVSYIFADQILVRDFSTTVRERAENETEQLAGRTNDRILWMLEVVTMVVDAVPFENFSVQELPQALSIAYNQLSFATVVALLDDNGKAVVPPYHPSKNITENQRRPFVSDAELNEFARNVPLKTALKVDLAMGPVYYSTAGDPRVVITKSVVADDARHWVLAIGVSLGDLCGVMGETESQTGYVSESVLADGKGSFVCGGGSFQRDFVASKMDMPLKKRSITEHSDHSGGYFLIQEQIPVTGWRLFYRFSKEAALHRFYQIRKLLLIWMAICLMVAVGGGFVLAKGITAPLDTLAEVSRQVADGNYNRKIDVFSRDEIGELSRTFNRMVDEIHTWNRELHRRVDEKTKALKEAQEQIIKTQKLAALGELGAGVAHEINNPLTGVVGNAQFLLQELEDNPTYRKILTDIVNNSRRVAQVVDDLLRFSQAQWGERMLPVSLEKILVRSVDFYLERFKERGVEVAWKHKDDDVTVYGIERDLQLVTTSLIDNALNAVETKSGGQILLTVKKIDAGAVQLSIEDNGCGMDEATRLKAVDPFFTTHPPGRGNRGIGLTTVERIVDEHEAKMTIESEPGRGTLVSIYFASEITVSKS
ncbi:MAG: HAMP domain-containing protein [Deltaproteobacteria bacterium]|nr:HAMP domain-containing protein [Deltaproteobacteria bacterium]